MTDLMSGLFWWFVRSLSPRLPPLDRWGKRHLLVELRKQYVNGGRLWRQGAEWLVKADENDPVVPSALATLDRHEARMKALARIIRDLEREVESV